MKQIQTKGSIVKKYIFTYSTLAYFLFISLLTVLIAGGLYVYQVKEMAKQEIRLVEKEKELNEIQRRVESYVENEKQLILIEQDKLERLKNENNTQPLPPVQKAPSEASSPIPEPIKKVKVMKKGWLYTGDKGCIFKYDGEGLVPLLDGYGNQKGCEW